MSGRASRSNPRLNRFTGDSSRLTHMNQQLQRINSRIEAKLREFRHEAEANGQLMARATRLTERLELLRHKLRLCFELSGEARPANLQIVLKQMADVDPDDAPPEFVCPITQCIMVDPVTTVDGGTYDRAAIAEWIASFQAKDQVPTSPLTNLLLPDTTLRPNTELRQQIMAFLRTKESEARRNDENAVGGAEEPSLRIVPEALLSKGPAAASSGPLSSPNSARAPIWSSAVVPLHEANSRELNLLRVSDFDVPSAQPPTPLSSSASLRSANAATIAQRTTGRPGFGPPPYRQRLVSPGHRNTTNSYAPRSTDAPQVADTPTGMLISGHTVALPTSQSPSQSSAASGPVPADEPRQPPHLARRGLRENLYEMPALQRGAAGFNLNLNVRRRQTD
jgi:hypothetical protein